MQCCCRLQSCRSVVMNLIMMDGWETSHVAYHDVINSKLGATTAGLRGVDRLPSWILRHCTSLNSPLCRWKLCSLCGRTVTGHEDDPFSFERVTHRLRSGVRWLYTNYPSLHDIVHPASDWLITDRSTVTDKLLGYLCML